MATSDEQRAMGNERRATDGGRQRAAASVCAAVQKMSRSLRRRSQRAWCCERDDDATLLRLRETAFHLEDPAAIAFQRAPRRAPLRIGARSANFAAAAVVVALCVCDRLYSGRRRPLRRTVGRPSWLLGWSASADSCLVASQNWRRAVESTIKQKHLDLSNNVGHLKSASIVRPANR